MDLGFRAVIGPSFADIFSGNSFKNGLLLVALPQEAVDRLMALAAEGQPITIDLENQMVTTPYQDRFAFPIDPFRKHCLLNGLDDTYKSLGVPTGPTVRSIALLGEVIAEMLADAGMVDTALVRAPFEHLCRGLSSSNVRAR
jgi:hypothetical protein